MVDVAHADVVAVLTRAPAAGGKSRLFAELGLAPDAALLEALLLDTIDGAAGGGARLVVAVTPPDAVPGVRRLVRADVVAQPAGDLGERMRGTMAALFAAGAARVALIGSDLPGMTPSRIAGAFAALDRDPGGLVLGPALDGGYYLIAAGRVPPVFTAIRWGGPTVLEETRAAAARAGLRVHEVEALADVDTVADLRQLTSGAPRTRAWLRSVPPGRP